MGPVVDLSRVQKALRDLDKIAAENPELHEAEGPERLATWLDAEKADSDDDTDAD